MTLAVAILSEISAALPAGPPSDGRARQPALSCCCGDVFLGGRGLAHSVWSLGAAQTLPVALALLSACPDAGPRPPCGHTEPRPAAPQVAVSLGGAWLIWSGFIFHRDVRNRRAAPSAAASREPVAVASVDSEAETALHGGWTQTSRVPSTGSRHCLHGDGDENSLTRLPIRPYLFSHFR